MKKALRELAIALADLSLGMVGVVINHSIKAVGKVLDEAKDAGQDAVKKVAKSWSADSDED